MQKLIDTKNAVANKLDDVVIGITSTVARTAHNKNIKAHYRKINRLQKAVDAKLAQIEEFEPIEFELTPEGEEQVAENLHRAFAPFEVDAQGTVTR